MNDEWSTVLIALIGSLPALVIAVTGFVIQMRQSQATDAKVEEVHKSTNSMKDQLVAATKAAALQQGHLDGVADQKRVSAGERSDRPAQPQRRRKK